MARHDDAEGWVRSEWLPAKFGQGFAKKSVRLDAGGSYACDAVSDDGGIGVAVTTCSGRTKGNNPASAKMSKVREDVLFLLMAPFRQRFVLLTDRGMFDRCESERMNGRMPSQVEFLFVEFPAARTSGEKTGGNDE